MNKFVMARMKDDRYALLLSGKALFEKPDLSDTVEYTTDRKLDDGQWFVLHDFSQKNYFPANMPSESTSLQQFVAGFQDIRFLVSVADNMFMFQNVTKGRRLEKKFIYFEEKAEIKENSKMIIIQDTPDAIYDKSTGHLYFSNFPSAKSLFPGLMELYKEATDDETRSFLSKPFINLRDGFDVTKVKVANRQRIALAISELNNIGGKENDLFHYIHDYVPSLPFDGKAFSIGSETELKYLLYGIEQRFFTTQIGNKQFIATSIDTVKALPKS